MSQSAHNAPGSKASSPQDPPKSQIDFQFLNFSHPADAKASRARKAVRSHVTRRQHQNEHAAQAARRAQSYQGPSSETEQPPPRREHAQTLPTNRPNTLELPENPGAGVQGASSPEASSPSPSPTASPTYPPERQVDLSEIYPAAWHPYIPRVLVREQLDTKNCALQLTLTVGALSNEHRSRHSRPRRAINKGNTAVTLLSICHDRPSADACCHADGRVTL